MEVSKITSKSMLRLASLLQTKNEFEQRIDQLDHMIRNYDMNLRDYGNYKYELDQVYELLREFYPNSPYLTNKRV